MDLRKKKMKNNKPYSENPLGFKNIFLLPLRKFFAGLLWFFIVLLVIGFLLLIVYVLDCFGIVDSVF